MSNQLFPSLKTYIEEIVQEFEQISPKRKNELKAISDYAQNNEVSNFIFICTHNSRRSHLTQIWAQVAAHYYGFEKVYCFSGGTEATAFFPSAVQALQETGLIVEDIDESENPEYYVKFSKQAPEIIAFSKKYDDPSNPKSNFAAVMTCSDADENCPYISGATTRIKLTYEDPKKFDGTDQQEEKYRDRCRQIARELFYAFSIV